MKTKYYFFYLILGVLLLAFSSSTSNNDNKDFYYAFSEKVHLVKNENTLLVKYKSGFDRNKEEKFVKESTSGVKIKWLNKYLAEISTETLNSIEELNKKFKIKDEVVFSNPLHSLEDGLIMGVTDEILIQFLPGVSDEKQKELHRQFKTKLVKTTNIYNKLIVPKGESALKIANAYYETSLVEFATPNFISKPVFFQNEPNDPYFVKQIALHNTSQVFTDGHYGKFDADIDALEAWDISTGSNDIVIAVIDQGVTSDHPDLPNTRQVRLNGSNFGDGDPRPFPNI